MRSFPRTAYPESANSYSGSDHKSELRSKLETEWDSVPLVNERLAEDIEGQTDTTSRITLVHVGGFFTDGCDFAYYVKGGHNMSRFLLGTFSGVPYDKPCFATPICVFEVQELLCSEGADACMISPSTKLDARQC
jgi:hypothetical protein